MVASIDGSIAVDGTSAKLSSPTDIAVLARLRRLADVIVVGAGTVRDEGYGAPRKHGQRIGIVTRSGGLDFDSEHLHLRRRIRDHAPRAGAPDVPDRHRRRPNRHRRASISRGDRAARPTSSDAPTTCRSKAARRLNGAMLRRRPDRRDQPHDLAGHVRRSRPTPGDRVHRAHAHRFEVAQLAIDDESFVYTRWLRRRD